MARRLNNLRLFSWLIGLALLIGANSSIVHAENIWVHAVTGECLDSDGLGNVYMLPCNGGDSQRWAPQAGPDGTRFVNIATGLCLEGDAAGIIYTLACNGGGHQQWAGGIRTTGYDITSVVTSHCLRSNDSGSVSGEPCDGTDYNRWRPTFIENEDAPIFSEDFNTYTAGGSSTQCGTGLAVHAFGTFSNWQNAGSHTAHAVTLDPGDLALTMFDTNQVTMATGVAANELGASYRVTFDAGPSVWAACGQASSGDESLRFTVLRADNTVLKTYDRPAQTWAGSQTLVADSFLYTGDGTGNVRLRIQDVTLNGRSAGAVDNIEISIWYP